MGQTEEETQRVVNVVLPYIELSLIPSIVEFLVQQSLDADQIWEIALSSTKWNELGTRSDPFSSKLKQAALMSMFGYHRVSLAIVNGLGESDVYSICSCSPQSPFFPEPEVLLQAIARNTDITSQEILFRHLVPCVVFLPSER